jgi:hypothetical protein
MRNKTDNGARPRLVAQARVFGEQADRYLLWATDRLGWGQAWAGLAPAPLIRSVLSSKYFVWGYAILSGTRPTQAAAWGQWEALREHVATDPLFRFDYYAKSRTSNDIRRRGAHHRGQRLFSPQ